MSDPRYDELRVPVDPERADALLRRLHERRAQLPTQTIPEESGMSSSDDPRPLIPEEYAMPSTPNLRRQLHWPAVAAAVAIAGAVGIGLAVRSGDDDDRVVTPPDVTPTEATQPTEEPPTLEPTATATPTPVDLVTSFEMPEEVNSWPAAGKVVNEAYLATVERLRTGVATIPGCEGYQVYPVERQEDYTVGATDTAFPNNNDLILMIGTLDANLTWLADLTTIEQLQAYVDCLGLGTEQTYGLPDPGYQAIAIESLDVDGVSWVRTELTSAEGRTVWYAADIDGTSVELITRNVEGTDYTWTPADFDAVLTDVSARINAAGGGA